MAGRVTCDVKNRQKMSVKLPDVQPVIVASHPRSGTHLLMDLLRRQFGACRSWKWPGERLDRLYCTLDELGAERGRLDTRTARRILSRTRRPIVKTHAWPGLQDTFLAPHHDGIDPAWIEWLDQNGTVLYVHRDGRDVLCSYQLFRQKFDSDADGSVGAFLRQKENGENRVRRWAAHVRAWRAGSGVYSIQFERLLDQPKVVIRTLGEVLGLEPTWTEPILPPPFHSIWESRWARLARMRPESTAIINGERQDWRERLTAEDRAFFHEHAGDLLIELGYEASDAWVDEAVK